MKNFIFTLLLFFVGFASYASPAYQAVDAISKALKAGDASAVAKHFDSSVDVTILKDANTYSKSQAEQVLKSFFSKNKVTGFTKKHDVASKSGSSESFVGDMTAGGKNYRVYVLLSSSGSSQIIQEISIRER